MANPLAEYMTTQLAPQMSTPLPPLVAPNQAPPMSNPLPPQVVPNQPMGLEQYSPYNVVNDVLGAFTNNEGPYLANARRRGLEMAGRRGLLNSSIAAGNAERSALEAVQPLVSETVGLLNQRENRATQFNMQERQNQFQRQQQQDNAVLENWLSGNQFNRQFNAQLSMMPIQNTYQLLQNIMQYGLENPEIYTPDIINGTANFFTRQMFDVMGQYFPSLVSTGGNP